MILHSSIQYNLLVPKDVPMIKIIKVEAKALYTKFNDYDIVKTIPAGEGTYLDVATARQ